MRQIPETLIEIEAYVERVRYLFRHEPHLAAPMSSPLNIANRIERFLNTLQRANRPPNRRELFWMRQALVNLEKAEYPAGEEAMERAERAFPVPAEVANDPSTNAGTPVEQLRAQLDEIMKAGA